MHEQKWRNEKHRKQFLASLACYAYPVLGNTTVSSIDTAAVLRVVEPIWLSKTETANRVRGRIESVLERFGSPNYRRSPLARKRLDCGLHRARAENDKSTGESYVKKLNRNTKGQDGKLRQCYVYEIRIDGVVRYIGKGRNGRIYSHLIDAKRTASRSDVKIGNLSPHFRKMLVSAVRRGSNIAEMMVASNLTDGRPIQSNGR